MEHQWLLALHHAKCWLCVATLLYNRTIGRLSWQKGVQQHRYCVLKPTINGGSTECQRSVNAASMMYGDATCIIQRLCIDRYPESPYWLPLLATIPTRILLPPRKNLSSEWQDILWVSVSFTVTRCLGSFLNAILECQSICCDAVCNLTTMHAVSHWSYYCLSSNSRVNI